MRCVMDSADTTLLTRALRVLPLLQTRGGVEKFSVTTAPLLGGKDAQIVWADAVENRLHDIGVSQ